MDVNCINTCKSTGKLSHYQLLLIVFNFGRNWTRMLDIRDQNIQLSYPGYFFLITSSYSVFY